MKLTSLLSLGLALASAPLALAQSGDLANPDAPAKPGDWDTYSDTWSATDGLGRTLPDNSTVGDPKPDKFVGIFCFEQNNIPGIGANDNTKQLNADPNKRNFPAGVSWWGKPWFGYYISSDPAVIRKHAQMLADAGVDVMIYDNTNGPTYPEVRESICKVLTEMRAEGLKTPQIAFFAGQKDWNDLYHNFYQKNMYPDLWFRWQGKPLMLVHTDNGETLPPEVTNFFTIRESWAWTDSHGWFKDGHDKWPWLDSPTGNYGWDKDPKTPEEMSVCVAQHASTSIGRSFNDGHGGEPPLDKLSSTAGVYFQQEWDKALKVNPEFIFVTGWDEWTAGNYPQDHDGIFAGHSGKKGESMFIDEYDEEFSRDIEPEDGALQDDYYYQLVANIRKFKGVRPVPPVEHHPIQIDGHYSDWDPVKPEFRDDIGDPVHRDSAGWDKDVRYVNKTGRNDIVAAKVSYDGPNLYFYVRTKDPITPNTDPNWMLLYIDSDNNPKTGWLGYDFVVNHADIEGGTTTLQQNVDGKYQWKTVARIQYWVSGNEMELAIPRSLLGLDFFPAQVNFKWADNIQQTGDASDFTLNGDVAPNDRFNFTAKLGVQ